MRALLGVSLLLALSQVAGSGAIVIACEGNADGGVGGRNFQYELMNTGPGLVVITSFTVATDDPNLANYTNPQMPAGFVLGMAGGNLVNQGVQTPHGGFSPLPLEMSAATVTFTTGGPGVPLPADGFTTITFGFNNPSTYQDAEWTATGFGTQWASPVAGPFGVFTDGPVHAPAVPEPASMLAVGSALLGLAAVRRWKVSR